MRKKLIPIIVILSFLVCFPCFGKDDRKKKHRKVKITMPDSIFLALRHNRTIESAYLNRISQKYGLAVAEDEFIPDLTITTKGTRSYSDGTPDTRSTTSNAGVSFNVSERIQTGGQFNFVWDNDVTKTTSGQYSRDSSYAASWNLTFSQPLLRGGGIDVNTASQNIARLSEEQNILSLKSTIMSTITSVITTYRSYLQTFRQLSIADSSLKRAKHLLSVNKALIDAGRMARVEIVQTKADIANREFNLLSSENNLDRARLSLIQILDIEKQTMIDVVEEGKVKPVHPSLKDCTKIALKNRPDYLQALISLKIAKINLEVAKNNRLWDLNFDAGVTQSGDHYKLNRAEKRLGDIGRPDWNVGLNLSIPFGDVARHQSYVSSEIGLRNQRIALHELKENVEIEIEDKVRDVEMKLRQLELARLARDLSRQKLDIENEKLKSGRTTNFQIVTFENDLVSAENSELDAMISYQNALTNLDLALGTTLKTWKIRVKDKKETASSILKKLKAEEKK